MNNIISILNKDERVQKMMKAAQKAAIKQGITEQEWQSWIEYLHPKLGYPIIARIEEEEKIKKQYKIIKKVVNMECIYSEA